MQVKARTSPGYRWRLAAVAVLGLGWGLWSAYDGIVGYPEHNRHVDTFNQFKERHGDAWRDLWPTEAKQHGWSEKEPRPRKSRFDIYSQYVMAAITLPTGLIFLISFVRTGSRWIASDGATLTTSWGQTAPFDSITSVNKDRWKTKGIAVVNHGQDGGESRLILDDWKYERDPITHMVEQLDKHFGHGEDSDEVAPDGDETKVDADSSAQS